jgi:hypothetical protein
MKLADFAGDWTGDGFSAVRRNEAYCDETPACDALDDIVVGFAERSRRIVIESSVVIERDPCAVCGAVVERHGVTCSRECAAALARTAKTEAGMVFGDLTAVRQVGSKNGAIWEFRCTCGNTVERVAYDVRHRARLGRRVCCSSCSGARVVGALTATEMLASSERNLAAWRRSVGGR